MDEGHGAAHDCRACRGHAVLPLYAGDDANDADALIAAADLGGIAIGIGPRAPSLARYRLPDAWSLGCVLDVLLDMLVESEAADSSSIDW